MGRIILILLTLISYVSFGQDRQLIQIDTEISTIEANTTLELTEFDPAKRTEIATDGGRILKIWHQKKQIHKIAEEIGLSYGRIRTTVYLKNGIPVKIIETEEHFEQTHNGLNDQKLTEVYKAERYVFDWKNNKSTIKQAGKRVLSEDKNAHIDYKQVIERARKVIAEQNSNKKP